MKKNICRIGIVLPSLCLAAFLGGCSTMLLLEPKGPIGDAERSVIVAAFALMLIVVLPAIIMTFWFARRYRAANTKATYAPEWSHWGTIELVIWLVPALIVTALGILTWRETYHLDPYRPIDPYARPINIEAVSLDWKWLFIYPDQEIATVNQLVFPANVPLSFRLTSDTVMTSFFIPQLGSQIYAMAGMQTRLHLMADEPGVYHGQNQQFSGRGFSDMHFKAIALSREDFEAWVQETKKSSDTLNLARFEELEAPSVGHPVTYFSSVEPGLFAHVISKFMSMGVDSGAVSKEPGSAPMKTGAPEES